MNSCNNCHQKKRPIAGGFGIPQLQQISVLEREQPLENAVPNAKWSPFHIWAMRMRGGTVLVDEGKPPFSHPKVQEFSTQVLVKKAFRTPWHLKRIFGKPCKSRLVN
jgi:hypothetical protein